MIGEEMIAYAYGRSELAMTKDQLTKFGYEIKEVTEDDYDSRRKLYTILYEKRQSEQPEEG